MTIKIRTLNRSSIEIETEGRIGGRKVGDLIEEQCFSADKLVKAIVVGLEHKNGSIWTVDERTVVDFKAGFWLGNHVSEKTKLIERPVNPDLTIEGLKRSLENFINKDR